LGIQGLFTLKSHTRPAWNETFMAAETEPLTLQEISLVCFFFIYGMGISWLVIIKLFFNRLERAHPKKYKAMGRPSLYLRNNCYTGWTTFRFLAAREHRELNDRYLSSLSDALLFLLPIYVILFIAYAVFVFGYVVHAPAP